MIEAPIQIVLRDVRDSAGPVDTREVAEEWTTFDDWDEDEAQVTAARAARAARAQMEGRIRVAREVAGGWLVTPFGKSHLGASTFVRKSA